MGKIAQFFDGMANVISGLSTAADSHAAGAHWFMRPISQQELEASYRTSWASRKAHSIIPADIIRPWRGWQAEPDQITALEREERRLGLRQKVRKALLWSRLYGGAAIMLGVNGDNPSEPLDVTRVRKQGLQYIHVLTRHEMTITGINMDPGSAQYGEPLMYLVNGGGQQTPVHPSRMVRFVHGELPDQLAFGEQTWGDPLLVSLRDAIVNLDTAQGAFGALSVKARTSTLKVPDLVNMASAQDGERKLIARTQVAKRFESMFHINLISAPSRQGEAGEEWQNETYSFTGIPDMGIWFIQAVAAACDIPLTRFMGTSPGGLNSTGAGDLENYYNTLSAGRELDLRPRLEMIDEVLIRSALGNRPESVWFTFGEFQVDNATVKATNSKTRADALKALADSGAVPEDVLTKIAKGQITESGDYPGADEAYEEYEKAGEVEPLATEAEPAANDNVLAAATEGLVAQGRSASVAARDAKAMLTDAVPMPLYVSRKVLNRDDLQTWATEQGLGELQPDLHATILFSRQPVDWISMGTTWIDKDGDGSGRLQVNAGGPRCVEPLGDRTAVLMFSNTDMQYRHEEMVRLGASHDYSDFTLHISLTGEPVDLTNIQPYRGVIEFGPEIFERLDV